MYSAAPVMQSPGMARSTWEAISPRAIAGGLIALTLVATPPAAWAEPPVSSVESEPAPAPGPGSTRDASYRILLLQSESRLTPSVVSTDRALRSTLEARSSRRIYFYTEFLDLNSFHGEAIQDELRRLLREKYRGRRIDLIAAQGQLTVPFALQMRAELFPGVPIVFVAVEESALADLPPGSMDTGTWRRRGWAETLDLARRLHPGTRRAVVIVGSSAAERLWLETARQQLEARRGSIEISYLVDSSVEDLVTAVAGLPKDTVVLMGPFLRDGTGRDFTTPAVVKRLIAVAPVPIYGLTDTVVGSGAIGGDVVSFEAHGKMAARLILNVLAGQHPPPTSEGTTIPMFDDREIRRWGIDRRLLPAGSVVLFREPSLWELYRGYVVVAVVLLLVQTGLIIGLTVQRAQRRRAQRNLAQRVHFETLVADLSEALASCPAHEIDGQIVSGLRRIVEDLGTDRASLWSPDDRAGLARVTHSWTRDGVPPVAGVARESEFPWVFEQVRQGQTIHLSRPGTGSLQMRTDQRNLAGIQTQSAAVAPLVEGGLVVGALSVGSVRESRHWPDELMPRLRLLADIFANALARQRAERAADESARDIRDLAGRLMTAQEEERRRIARELHDGVNQDVAALSIVLSAVERGLPWNTPGEVREQVARLQARAVELAETIRHLSHELHPGILQYVGLSAGLRSYCREFELEHGLPVTCRADDDIAALPADLALCLYRVTQEALRNAAQHAKAARAWVTLARDGQMLVLAIQDDGGGFDVAEARGRKGLGLISLDERARLAGGRLTIDSGPLRGTEVRVVVPLP